MRWYLTGKVTEKCEAACILPHSLQQTEVASFTTNKSSFSLQSYNCGGHHIGEMFVYVTP